MRHIKPYGHQRRLVTQAGIEAQGKGPASHTCTKKAGSALIKTHCCISGNQENYKVKKEQNQDRGETETLKNKEQNQETTSYFFKKIKQTDP